MNPDVLSYRNDHWTNCQWARELKDDFTHDFLYEVFLEILFNLELLWLKVEMRYCFSDL